MNYRAIAYILGLCLLLFSATLLPNIILSLAVDDGEAAHFIESALMLAGAGLLLWAPNRVDIENLRTRDGFLIVSLFWVVLGGLGSLPLIFGAHLNTADAVFEAVSGFTTTGATVMSGLDSLPLSLQLYRQQLQWYGGIGVIVFAVAILPMLGVGGMQLYKAETPGPVKNEKLTPRIAHTAQFLITLYIGMTVICTLAYWYAGMSLFDAIAHSFTTLSTGGFSNHDASIAYYDSLAIETIAIVFMLLGGISFSIHYFVWNRKNPLRYFSDTQTRVFLGTTAMLSIVIAVSLVSYGYTANPGHAFRLAVFEVVSVITSTGYGVDNFTLWPAGLPVLLIFISFMGGCAGSTAGGMKTIRILVLFREALRQMRMLVHPKMIAPLKIGKRVVDPGIISAVRGFISAYVIIFIALLLLLMGDGVDMVTAYGAIATCMNNLGPGLGDVATTFSSLSDSSIWVCTFAMLLGRLEIFTLLVIFTPVFWTK